MIVAQGVEQSAADNESLVGLVDQVKQNTGRKPQRVLVDAGYRGEGNFRALEKRKIRGFVAQRREGRAYPAAPTGAGRPAGGWRSDYQTSEGNGHIGGARGWWNRPLDGSSKGWDSVNFPCAA